MQLAIIGKRTMAAFVSSKNVKAYYPKQRVLKKGFKIENSILLTFRLVGVSFKLQPYTVSSMLVYFLWLEEPLYLQGGIGQPNRV